MRKNPKLILIITLALALLAVAALPSLAQTSGKLNLECSEFTWEVQGDNCLVKTILDKQEMGSLTLTPDNPIQQVNYKHGNCGLNGTFKLWAKKTWGQGKLDMNLTITQGSSTYGHQGTVATW
ncbi:MAG: hypothetical protein KQH53_11200 [Desulfarculaceae bacterium]|nr:hypothetical protein [Desulfarculaceae bacterium]